MITSEPKSVYAPSVVNWENMDETERKEVQEANILIDRAIIEILIPQLKSK